MKDKKTNVRSSIALSVRDYECDIEGIVNNAVYLNYLEHARHELLKEIGVSFIELHRSGVDPVVVRIEIDYRTPLRSGDRFVVKTKSRRVGSLRFVFDQNIHREHDDELACAAVVVATFLSNGKPVPPPETVLTAFSE